MGIAAVLAEANHFHSTIERIADLEIRRKFWSVEKMQHPEFQQSTLFEPSTETKQSLPDLRLKQEHLCSFGFTMK